MDKLLSVDGCAWDRAQTHESLRQYLLEETYEAIDAINKNDMSSLCEELGDILLEVVFHSKIAEKQNQFTIEDVISGITKKIVNRHKHIFEKAEALTPEGVSASWDKIKDEEKGYKNVSEKMRAVPDALPALIRAEKIQKRSELEKSITTEDAGDILFLLQDILNVCADCSNTHMAPTDAAEPDKQHIESQIGMMLFHIVRICRLFKVNPEFALTNALETYITRFEN